MLEVENINKQIAEKKILDHITFTLEPGTITGLIGRNGVGKTTLLRTMAGILLPDSGDVRYTGKGVYLYPEHKSNFMFIPENKLTLQNYTAKQSVRLYKLFYPSFDETYIGEKMSEFKLPANKKIRQFSKGMKGLFSLILAFATRADVILLDEPTDGLDAIVKHQWYQMLIGEVASQQHTVLISSHRLSELESVCDQVMILKDNRMNAKTDLTTLKNRYHKLQIVYDANIPPNMLQLSGTQVLSQSGRVLTLMVEDDYKTEVMAKTQATGPLLVDELPLSLEELFVATVNPKNGGEQNVR